MANWEFEEDEDGNLCFVRKGQICATLTPQGLLIARSMSQSTDYEPTPAGVQQIQDTWETLQEQLEQRMLLLGCSDDEFYQA